MPSGNDNHAFSASPSIPIPISTRRGRGRSVSVSSASSSSASSGGEYPTTPAGSFNSRGPQISSPSSSPILSYFMAQSPTKSSGTAFPFKRNFGPAPVFEEDEHDKEIPVAAHARRASVAVASKFSGPSAQNGPMPEAMHDRGAGMLRRLSLSSSAFAKAMDPTHGRRSPPAPPPNSAVSPVTHRNTPPHVTRPRRSATISADGARPRRAPSPMGERILKGHFDGFN